MIKSAFLDSGNGFHTTLDTWLKNLLKILDNWTFDEPCLLLYDLRKMGKIGIDNFLHEHFETLDELYPHLKPYTAIVMPGTLEESQFRLVLQGFDTMQSSLKSWKVLTSRPEPVQWLLAQEWTYLDLADTENVRGGQAAQRHKD